MNILIVGGLSVEAFTKLQSVPGNKFVPGGKWIGAPVKFDGYPPRLADTLIARAQAEVASLPEATRVSVLLAYVDYGDSSSKQFSQAFFPFALSRSLPPLKIGDNCSRPQRAAKVSDYVSTVQSTARDLIDRAKAISAETNVSNLTPLLLPLRNFRNKQLEQLLSELYDRLGTVENPVSLLRSVVKEFHSRCPRVKPPSSERHCFSDNKLYFQSPGRNRHGYYRHAADVGHAPSCLLNARSRLGGQYSHSFHFDCTPVRGKLLALYPNCHDHECAPGQAHINIAPNDYVI